MIHPCQLLSSIIPTRVYYVGERSPPGAVHVIVMVITRASSPAYRADRPRLSRSFSMSKFSRSLARTFAVVAFSVAATSFASAQAAPPAAAAAAAAPTINPTVLKVGDVAPDFTVAAVTAIGLDAKPFKLSEHKGETIVLAFFPKARTGGCTMQMHAYRDKYNEMFKGGKKVTVVGVSIDEDSALTSWAKDDNIPFHFAADVDRKVGVAYGASMGTGSHKRYLYVIDPKGKISYVATPFRQASEEAYTELGAAVASAQGAK